jgi:2-oxoglutarate ferredoxin oxidoreductase subunit gamma
MRQEIILSGSGGQGLILAGTILAEAAGVLEGKNVVQTQSYGIQARGGASQATVIISDRPINFPEALTPDLLLCLSQEAYERYMPRLRSGGLLILDGDLVRSETLRADVTRWAFPFTAEAERLNQRIAANMVALGALAGVSGVVGAESLAHAIPSRLPERHVPLALKALDAGVQLAELRNLPAS